MSRTPGSPLQRALPWILLAAAVIVAGGLAIRTIAARGNGYQGTDLGLTPAPAFHLVDQQGTPRSLTDYHGKAVLLTFMDGHCKNLCPTTLMTMADLQKRLGRNADQLAIVAVSADPWLDRIGKPAAIATEPGAVAPRRWDFLTGRVDQLRPVWNAYHVDVQEQQVGKFSANGGHDSGFFLIDARGRERLYIASTAPMGVLLRQARKVIHEG